MKEFDFEEDCLRSLEAVIVKMKRMATTRLGHLASTSFVGSAMENHRSRPVQALLTELGFVGISKRSNHTPARRLS